MAKHLTELWKGRGKYSQSHYSLRLKRINNCFSIYTRSDLNKIREENMIDNKLHYSCMKQALIFKRGNSQVYYFANNSVMA